MASQLSKTSKVKDGYVTRDAITGRFMEVRTENTVSKVSQKSELVAKIASGKRKDALKRLADR